ncbi:hypothetical protein JTE90_018188 [Oedothorax gibbosus]|uniref:Uncharacterized protein n=1 Tax=Oedothorax gibbosus TaxID=931172 RepID=A0AAV6U8R3_9ARAC|nr:hypothetical protein JTE90_018188 [Oedothorax gibbosus]
MFSLLANGALTIRDPASGTNLYLLFDDVHLLKSIPNNWLNQADKDKTFTCPIFEEDGETEEGIIRPRFGLLRTTHRLEESSNVKCAFHLNAKTLSHIYRKTKRFASSQRFP